MGATGIDSPPEKLPCAPRDKNPAKARHRKTSQACKADLLLQTMTTLKLKTDSCYPLAVLGDFNVDPARTPNLIKKIESILDCKQKQTEYTYIPNDDEKTRIDLVFTNADSTTTGVIDSLFSNHRVVTFQC